MGFRRISSINTSYTCQEAGPQKRKGSSSNPSVSGAVEGIFEKFHSSTCLCFKTTYYYNEEAPNWLSLRFLLEFQEICKIKKNMSISAFKLANWSRFQIFSEFALRLTPLQPGKFPFLEQHGGNQTYGVQRPSPWQPAGFRGIWIAGISNLKNIDVFSEKMLPNSK